MNDTTVSHVNFYCPVCRAVTVGKQVTGRYAPVLVCQTCAEEMPLPAIRTGPAGTRPEGEPR